MIEKASHTSKWLEFHLLQEFTGLKHRVTLKGQPPEGNPVSARQVHGDGIVKLPAKEPLAADALTTDKPRLPIAVKHADCQAAIIYDPVVRAAACVHSGWRGSVQNIYGKAIARMRSLYGSNPTDLVMCIGPSLGPGRAEFVNYKTELPEEFWDFQVKPCYFDFWEISRKQALDAGILPHHLEIAAICTYDNEEQFYSYRRNKTEQRHLTIAELL